MPRNSRFNPDFAERLRQSRVSRGLERELPAPTPSISGRRAVTMAIDEFSRLCAADMEARLRSAMGHTHEITGVYPTDITLTRESMQQMRERMLSTHRGTLTTRMDRFDPAMNPPIPGPNAVPVTHPAGPVAPPKIHEAPMNQERSLYTEIQLGAARFVQMLQYLQQLGMGLKATANRHPGEFGLKDTELLNWSMITTDQIDRFFTDEEREALADMQAATLHITVYSSQLTIWASRGVMRHPAVVMQLSEMLPPGAVINHIREQVILDYTPFDGLWFYSANRDGDPHTTGMHPARQVPYLQNIQIDELQRYTGSVHRGPDFVSLMDPLWRMREQARLRSGVYHKLPEAIRAKLPNEAFLEYPHLATKDSNAGLLAYTQSSVAGQLDRQQVIKPGRWLRRWLPGASDEDIKQMAALCAGECKVEFKMSNKLEDFVRVYSEGPDSCMGYKLNEDFIPKSWQHTRVDGELTHPVSVYAHPENDIAIAWLETGTGVIGARTLVNTESKHWVRLYKSDRVSGALGKLRQWLSSQGYREDGDALRGQKLLKLETDGGNYVCPYIDAGGYPVTVYDDYLRVGYYPSQGQVLRTDHSTGCTEEPVESYDWHCGNCSAGMHDDDDCYTTVGGDCYCESCAAGMDTVYDYASGDTLFANDASCENRVYSTEYYTDPHSGHDWIRFRNGLPAGVVLLDSDHYDSDCVAIIDDCTYTHEGTYVLTEDLDDHDLFYHRDEGRAEPIANWVVLDGKLFPSDELDDDLHEQQVNQRDIDYPMLDVYTTREEDEEDEAEEAA